MCVGFWANQQQCSIKAPPSQWLFVYMGSSEGGIHKPKLFLFAEHPLRRSYSLQGNVTRTKRVHTVSGTTYGRRDTISFLVMKKHCFRITVWLCFVISPHTQPRCEMPSKKGWFFVHSWRIASLFLTSVFRAGEKTTVCRF